MTVGYHAEFPRDIRRFEEQYRLVSARLAERFREEVEGAIERATRAPGSAGHYVNTGSKIAKEVRRVNLRKFPFFIVYSFEEEKLFFGGIVPSRSDPLMWLARWR
jgi:hypothetical protein